LGIDPIRNRGTNGIPNASDTACTNGHFRNLDFLAEGKMDTKKKNNKRQNS
jgi:hypothetical protein